MQLVITENVRLIVLKPFSSYNMGTSNNPHLLVQRGGL